MGNIYTRKGDRGETINWARQSIAKDSPLIHANGAVDECNATIGAARAASTDQRLCELLETIQNTLLVAGSDITNVQRDDALPQITAADVEFLEQTIDVIDQELPPLTGFILPSGSQVSAFLHMARTVCRRAERAMVTLNRETTVNPQLICYINRLSDCLFMLARHASHRDGVGDELWEKPQRQTSG